MAHTGSICPIIDQIILECAVPERPQVRIHRRAQHEEYAYLQQCRRRFDAQRSPALPEVKRWKQQEQASSKGVHVFYLQFKPPRLCVGTQNW